MIKFWLFFLMVVSTSNIIGQDNPSPCNNCRIAFKTTVEVSNEKLLDSTLNQAARDIYLSVIQDAKKEQAEMGDSIPAENLAYAEIMFGSVINTLDPRVNGQHNMEDIFVIRDSLIISYQQRYNKVLSDYIIINRLTNQVDRLAKKDSLTRFLVKTPYTYADEQNIQIEEFRSEVKKIMGYDCFKIVITAQDFLNDDLDKEIKYTKTMYVTEEIHFKYHPIVIYKTILNNYFPLEIIEYNNLVKGVRTIHEIENITID